MAIIKPCVKLILQNDPVYHYSGRALTLGVPEIYASSKELKKWFPALAGRNFPLAAPDVTITHHEIGRRLGWVSAATFFRSIGLTDVVSVDLPGGEYQPDLIHDLNESLPASLEEGFDLVLDPGTTEHVFDIKTALSNVVKSLKIGGIVIHQVPVYSYNGGYYSINPNVINDFYSVNGFGDLRTYIVMWDRYHAYTGRHLCYEYSWQNLGARHSLADYDQCRFSPQMLFFAKKQEKLPDIKIPRQFSGKYLAALSEQATPSRSGTAMTASVKGILGLLYRFLPYAGAYYLNAVASRKLHLYRARRASFWM